MLKRFFSQVGGDSMLKYFPRFFATTKIGGLTGDLKFNFEHH